MRPWLLLTVLAVVVLAGCAGPQQNRSGLGVQTSIIDARSFQDVYFQYYVGERRPTRDSFDNMGTGDLVKLFDIITLVHNRGYADSLAALYITGYDPNLFYVRAPGPYNMQDERRYCFKDVTMESTNGWSVSGLCEAGDDLYLGGGVQGTDGVDGIRLDVYNANVAEWLAGLDLGVLSEAAQLANKTGLFNDLSGSCSVDTRELSDLDANCRVSWGNPSFYLQRSSRGALALALFGNDLRDCKNGCILVPPSRVPTKYLAGDTVEYPNGMSYEVPVEVYLDRGRWPPNYNDHTQLFQVTACYLYTTYATPVVCIDPSPATQSGEGCSPGVLDLKAQPAPLRITRIDQRQQGSRIAFTIYVQNSLGGEVFDPGAIDYCSPAAPETYVRESANVASVIDARVLGSLEALDCRDGDIRLRNGQGQITCFYDLPPNVYGRAAYQTTLNIEIAYLYRDVHTVQANIHRT